MHHFTWKLEFVSYILSMIVDKESWSHTALTRSIDVLSQLDTENPQLLVRMLLLISVIYKKRLLSVSNLSQAFGFCCIGNISVSYLSCNLATMETSVILALQHVINASFSTSQWLVEIYRWCWIMMQWTSKFRVYPLTSGILTKLCIPVFSFFWSLSIQRHCYIKDFFGPAFWLALATVVGTRVLENAFPEKKMFRNST